MFHVSVKIKNNSDAKFLRLSSKMIFNDLFKQLEKVLPDALTKLSLNAKLSYI